MFDLKKIVRPNILNLKPYSSARDEFSGQNGIFLDANENPYGNLNRYPDPYQRGLKARLSAIKKISSDNIFIGNGSDEVIDLAFRIFCQPSIDKALTFAPSYGMYDVAAAINNVQLIKIPLDNDFQIDVNTVNPFLSNRAVKLIFICTPNNPTGNTMETKAIQQILENFEGIVIIDEAYADFSSKASWINQVNKYPNLIICQTFSKAWGLAAARVGMAFTNPNIIRLLNKVKPPYNVGQLNQEAALEALENIGLFEKHKELILKEKLNLKNQLADLPLVKKLYPSEANFLLVEVEDANVMYQELVNQKIIVRNRHKLVNNCIRISIGTPEENKLLIECLQELCVMYNGR